MIQLIKDEIMYNATAFITLFLTIETVLILVWIYREDNLGFLTAILTFSIVNATFTNIWKEKRFNRFALMPVSRQAIASYRIILTLVPFALLMVIGFLNSLVIKPFPVSTDQIIAWSNFILFVYSLYFVGNDLLAGRYLFGIAGNFRFFLTLTLALGMLALVLMFAGTKSGGIPLPIESIIAFLKLFGTVKFHIGLAAVNAALFITGIYTFQNRKQYLIKGV